MTILKSGDDLSLANVNELVPYYFMSCYLYYSLDLNVFTDHEFNYICKRILADYDIVEHANKKHLDKGELSASTGYTLKYSLLMKHAAVDWYETVTGTKIESDVLVRGKYNQSDL